MAPLDSQRDARSLPVGAASQNLVVVCQLFHPELVSTGQTLTELVEELSRRGLAVTVLAAQPTVLPGQPRVPRTLVHQGITIRRTWSTRFRKTSTLGKLLNLATFSLTAGWAVVRHHGRDQLLLLTNPPYLPLLGWLCHCLRRQTFGVILFDIMPQQAELLNFIKPGGLAARTWRRLNRLWYRRAAYVVVLSQDMLEGALQNAGLNGSPEADAGRTKTRVIHVWSDDRIIKPMAREQSCEANRLGVQDRFVVQYSGNHGRFHDLETLLAIAKTFQDDPRFVFQFIGEGQKKKLVEAYCQAGHPPFLFSETYVSKELLPDSLAMATLGVVAQMPGQERVCFPSKLLGILAAGRPVLAICPPGCQMARTLRQERLGYVVANGDVEGGRRTLLHALAHPDEVAELGRNAVRYLRQNWTLEQAAEAYAALIREHFEKRLR